MKNDSHRSDQCSKPIIDWLGTHTMRFEKSERGVETWRCVSCGFEQPDFSPHYQPKEQTS